MNFRSKPSISRTIKNISYLSLSGIFAQLLSLIAVIRVARNISPEIYGTVTTLSSLLALGGIVAAFGMRQVIVRMVSRDHSKTSELFISLLIFRSLSAVLNSLIFSLYIYFTIKEVNYFVYLIFLGGILIQAIDDIFISFAYGQEDIANASKFDLIKNVLYVAVILLTPIRFFTAEFLFGILVSSSIVKTIIFFTYEKGHNYFGRYSAPSIVIIKRLLKESAPYYWLAIMTSITQTIPVLMLSANSGKSQVAFYNIGGRFTVPLALLLNSSFVSLFPPLARAYKNDIEKFREVVKLVFLSFIFASIVFILIISPFTRIIITIIVGAKYLSAINIFHIQIILLLLTSLFNIIGTTISSSNNDMLLAKLSTIFSLLSLPFIIWGSFKGAEILMASILIAYFINMTYHYYYWDKIVKNSKEENIEFILLFFILVAIIIFLLASKGKFSPLELSGINLTILAGITYLFKKPLKKIILLKKYITNK